MNRNPKFDEFVSPKPRNSSSPYPADIHREYTLRGDRYVPQALRQDVGRNLETTRHGTKLPPRERNENLPVSFMDTLTALKRKVQSTVSAYRSVPKQKKKQIEKRSSENMGKVDSTTKRESEYHAENKLVALWTSLDQQLLHFSRVLLASNTATHSAQDEKRLPGGQTLLTRNVFITVFIAFALWLYTMLVEDIETWIRNLYF